MRVRSLRQLCANDAEDLHKPPLTRQHVLDGINAILKDPSVKSALNAQGFDLIGGTPEDFANLIRSESEKWAPVIKKTGAKID